jgi:hypothetical protein
MYPPLVQQTHCCHNIAKLRYFIKFLWIGGATVRFAPVVPWEKTGPAYHVKKGRTHNYDSALWIKGHIRDKFKIRTPCLASVANLYLSSITNTGICHAQVMLSIFQANRSVLTQNLQKLHNKALCRLELETTALIRRQESHTFKNTYQCIIKCGHNQIVLFCFVYRILRCVCHYEGRRGGGGGAPVRLTAFTDVRVCK